MLSYSAPSIIHYVPFLSHLLLVPPSLLQLGIQAVGSCCPLLCKTADSALHEAERLLSWPNLVQQYREVGAESSLLDRLPCHLMRIFMVLVNSSFHLALSSGKNLNLPNTWFQHGCKPSLVCLSLAQMLLKQAELKSSCKQVRKDVNEEYVICRLENIRWCNLCISVSFSYLIDGDSLLSVNSGNTYW